MNKVINKAYKAVWTCRGTFRKTWGLKPRVIYWIYTVGVRPIVTYAATVCWARVKLKRIQADFSKLQKMACLGITAAMRTAPTAAIEVLLGLPPLQLQVRAEAKAGNYRLCCNDQQKPKSKDFGRAYMTQDMKKEPILQKGSDKMILRNVYDKTS
jgi:hypothetical protein